MFSGCSVKIQRTALFSVIFLPWNTLFYQLKTFAEPFLRTRKPMHLVSKSPCIIHSHLIIIKENINNENEINNSWDISEFVSLVSLCFVIGPRPVYRLLNDSSRTWSNRYRQGRLKTFYRWYRNVLQTVAHLLYSIRYSYQHFLNSLFQIYNWVAISGQYLFPYIWIIENE